MNDASFVSEKERRSENFVCFLSPLFSFSLFGSFLQKNKKVRTKSTNMNRVYDSRVYHRKEID
jgi:hypothetical protein